MDLPIFLAWLRHYAEMPDTGELTIPVTEARLLLDILDAAMAVVERNEEIAGAEGWKTIDEACEEFDATVDELTRVVQVARDHGEQP